MTAKKGKVNSSANAIGKKIEEKYDTSNPISRVWNMYYSWIFRFKGLIRIILEALPFLVLVIVALSSYYSLTIYNNICDSGMIEKGSFIEISTSPEIKYKEKNLLYTYVIDSNLKIKKIHILTKVTISPFNDSDCSIINYNNNDVIKKDYNKDYSFALICNETTLPDIFELEIIIECKNKDDNSYDICKKEQVQISTY